MYGAGYAAYLHSAGERSGTSSPEFDWCTSCPGVPHLGRIFVLEGKDPIYLCPGCREDRDE
jgi:hypothetical protein